MCHEDTPVQAPHFAEKEILSPLLPDPLFHCSALKLVPQAEIWGGNSVDSFPSPLLLLSPTPYITSPKRLSLVAQMVKNLPVMWETRFDPCRREWLPIPVFSPREFHRQRNLASYSPWSHSVGHDRVKNVFFFHFSRGSQKYSVNLLTS